jgi:mono/diheme cytochrome c family protein
MGDGQSGHPRDGAAFPRDPRRGGLSVAAAASEAPGGDDKPYTVVDGAVDKGTYNGYRRYHADCHVCHGPDGLGSSYGPSLVESLKVLSYDDFVRLTLEGTARTAATTTYVMPPFAGNPNVTKHVDDIHAHLKARSDGVLGRGRPEKLKRQ